MSDNFLFFQAPPSYTLYGAGVVIGDVSVVLSSMLDIDGNALTMASTFGTIGFGTIDPGNGDLEEQICFTGLTNNSNGTTTLTGVSNVGFSAPYTQTSGLLKTHAGGAPFVISNTAGFYDKLTSKSDDETIIGTWTFPTNDPTRAGIGSDVDTAVATAFVTLGQLSRQAISGASNASTTVKGIVQLPTQAQMDAKTTTGSTGALLVPTPDVMRSTLSSDTVVDTGTLNTYVITPSPSLLVYGTGAIVGFKASTTNTGAATLNVNGLGARSITKNGNFALTGSDIITGLLVEVEYGNGAGGFQLISPRGMPQVSQSGAEVYAVDSVGTDAYAVILTPANIVSLTAGLTVRFKAGAANVGAATLAVNNLAAQALKKFSTSGKVALVTGDILQNQIVVATYDGTDFVMQSPTNATARLVYKIPAITPADDTNENAIFSTTIVAGLMASTGGIFIKIPFTTAIPPNGSTPTHAIKMKYGGTTVTTVNITYPNTGGGAQDGGIGMFDGFIGNNNATNSQLGQNQIMITPAASPNNAFWAFGGSGSGTAAVDSTADQTLTVTMQKSATGQTTAFLTGSVTIIN